MSETAIQKQEHKPASLAEIIKAKQASFADVATKYMTPERLVKLAIVAISKTPDLQRVPAAEVVAELINCSRLGLEPNVEGGRWLLPFKRKDHFELVSVTDYRGLIDIARRSGEVLSIHADMVCANDLWEFWVGSDGPTLVHLRHRRADRERGDILGAYAIVRLKNGEVQAEFLPLEKINEAKSRSRGASSDFSPWNRDFEAMAKKTAVRRLYNFLPKTPEIQAVREVLADEERPEEIALNAPPPPSGSRTESAKDKLRARTLAAAAEEAQPEEPEDRTLEPGEDPPAMGSRSVPDENPQRQLRVEDHVEGRSYVVRGGRR